jgi:hypothetical protein
MSLCELLKNMPDDVKVGTFLRIKIPPSTFPINDQVQLHICDKPENVPYIPQWSTDDSERLALGRENALLRERITALEIQNAELIRQAMQSMLAVDMPFVAKPEWVVEAYPIVKAESEPLPQSESDRIFWDALRMAAQT